MTEKNHRHPAFNVHGFRIAFYSSFAAFVVAVVLIQRWLDTGSNQSIVGLPISSPGDQMVSAFLAMTNILTSFSTALLGALGVLLLNSKAKRGPTATWFAFGSGVFAAISMFLGYVVYQEVLTLLWMGTFTPHSLLISWARYGQFFTFLLAFVLFGDFAIQSLDMEGANGPKLKPAEIKTAAATLSAAAGTEPRPA
jgi:hypothetical protein